MALTQKEVAAQFGLSRSHLLSMERQGLLEGAVTRTPGGHRRYSPDRLRSLIQAQDEPSAAEQAAGPRPDFREMGKSGLRKWGGGVYEERLEELQGHSGRILYREMRLNDPVIAAVFFALENALKQADWRVKPAAETPADKLAAEFVDSCLHDLSFSWHEQLTHIISPMLEQGFSLLEVVFKRRMGDDPPPYVKDPASSRWRDGRVGWRKWAPRPAESLEDQNEWDFDDNGGIQVANQHVETGGKASKPIKLPIERLLLFRTTVHPANTPEGLPIHRSMFVPWWMTKNIEEIEGIGVERDLAGVPVVYLGDDCSLQGANSDYERAKELVVNIRQDEQVGVVIPHAKLGTAGPGKGMLLELLGGGGGKEFDTTRILERYDKRKAVSVLAQFILLGMDRIGSYALSKNQSDLFLLSARAWLEGIADVINRHAIPKLMKYNVFPGLTALPQLVPGTLGLPDLTEVAGYVNQLVQAQVLKPDAELERHLRQVGGLPLPRVTVGSEEPIPAGGNEGEEEPEAEKIALLLRRIGLAVEPLRQIGTISDEEANEMLRPLVDEFKATLSKQGGGDGDAYRAERALRAEIQAAWDEMTETVEKADDDRADVAVVIAGALTLYRERVAKAIKAIYRDSWVAGRGEDFEAIEWSEVQKAVDEAEDYLANFLDELRTELVKEENAEGRAGLLKRRLARALMYSGGAWALYQVAKTWKQDVRGMWSWVGPGDSHSCAGCLSEIGKGPRPLYDFDVLPGGHECISNCRCSLVKVS